MNNQIQIKNAMQRIDSSQCLLLVIPVETASQLLSSFLTDTGQSMDLFSPEISNQEEEIELMDINEAKQQLGVSSSTLWRWRKSGKLKPCRIHGKILYRKYDITSLTK